MPLTNTEIRNAKPAGKTRKLFDGGGLYLEVSLRGGKWWRLKYRFGGKEKRLSLGVYPDVSLADARNRREEARKLLANDIDPSENRCLHRSSVVHNHNHRFYRPQAHRARYGHDPIQAAEVDVRVCY